MGANVSFVLNPAIIIGGVVVGCVTALIFGLLPIAQAANIRPLSVLRVENKSVSGRVLTIVLVVILGALLTLTGAVLSKVDPTLLTNGSSMTDAARVYADYMFARNLALALMLFLLLALRERRMLAGFMGLIALIQVIDVIDDLMRGAFVLVPGLLVFAIVFLVGAWRLFNFR